MTTNTNAGLVGYRSEMGEKRPAAAVIDAQLSHSGKHWFLRTPLTLKGRGIVDCGPIKAGEACGPRAAELVGMNQYKVTDAAFESIKARHCVACEMLL